jgi:hypothetical protein
MKYFKIVFALAIGVLALVYSFKFIRLYLKVKGWDRVSAVIVSKEIFLHPKYSTSRTPYGVKAEYTYQVNNVNYSGNKIYLIELAGGQANHMKSDAEEKLNGIDKMMSVYVNPEDPKESVMYCDGIGLYIFVFCMGVFSLLLGVGFMLSDTK